MDHDEPVLPVNINGNVFVGNFPKKTFIIASVFRFIYSKSEIIAAVGWEAFFALVGIISSTFCFSHGNPSMVQEIMDLIIETGGYFARQTLRSQPVNPRLYLDKKFATF